MGLEPTTSSVTGWRSKPTELPGQIDGDNRTRTCDSLLVRQVLYQLSYAPASVRPFPVELFLSPFVKRQGILYTRLGSLSTPFFNFFIFLLEELSTEEKQENLKGNGPSGTRTPDRPVMSRLL